ANSYNVFGFSFGEYCNGNTIEKYAMDLSGNAVFSITVSTPATNTATLELKFQMKDVKGKTLAFNKTVLPADKLYYQHEIGFSKNHKAPDYLALTPGMTANFTFDF